jgi:hypothetical protein
MNASPIPSCERELLLPPLPEEDLRATAVPLLLLRGFFVSVPRLLPALFVAFLAIILS